MWKCALGFRVKEFHQGRLAGEHRPEQGGVHTNMAEGQPPSLHLRCASKFLRSSYSHQVGEAGQKVHAISVDRPLDPESA